MTAPTNLMIGLGTGIIQIGARTPTMLAMSDRLREKCWTLGVFPAGSTT